LEYKMEPTRHDTTRGAAEMREARFQPRGFLRFDLRHGQLSTPDQRRYLVVPADLVRESDIDPEMKQAARRWGEEQGAALKGLVGPDVLERSPDELVNELAHLLATFGWGLCELETWGGVAFVVARHAPRGGATAILAQFLAGVFSAIGEDRFECVPIQRDGSVYFVLTGPECAAEIRSWVAQGAEVADVARRMHAGEHLPASLGGR
jgi:hypothetical protein